MPRSQTEVAGATVSAPTRTAVVGIWCCRRDVAHHRISVFDVLSCSRLARNATHPLTVTVKQWNFNNYVISTIRCYATVCHKCHQQILLTVQSRSLNSELQVTCNKLLNVTSAVSILELRSVNVPLEVPVGSVDEVLCQSTVDLTSAAANEQIIIKHQVHQ